MERLSRDWLAYLFLAGVIWFYIYVFIHARRLEKKNKEEKKKRDKA